MDEIEAHTLFVQWSEAHYKRGVFFDADFAPDDEANDWVEALVVGAVAAMTNAGTCLTFAGTKVWGGKVYAVLNGDEVMIRDVESAAADEAIPELFGHLDQIAAAQGQPERWNIFYDGDPAGMAYFVAPAELVASAELDVRDLDVGATWFRVTKTPDGYTLSPK
ncbi:Uncharacterised protein (plasmid) [Tsukamurella tyrosinosolvens]|uniref:Uncharacterized protein n=1 Tax=Tsukamurella tyrosinosolvens TaxID=57704 RepID=A0A1H4I698_TSUTY|nr:hypothetical protein [Tsukamurella tyrosinosolvens]KXO92757.1 hypothetical protein AXK58_19365 [Tsukamurella tyrosinosolvens]SEB29483.1 hypothetical protein SAMN04489793_0025 [Tsukamurella tyrosinosolvens]VEH95909.1 Uncharacterised protein [Tsukamurella tyrosinosolvens]